MKRHRAKESEDGLALMTSLVTSSKSADGLSPAVARTSREHCDVLSMQMDSDLVIYRTTLVRTFQVVTICRVDKSEVLVVLLRLGLVDPTLYSRDWSGSLDNVQ
ncbi:hypothetical protein F511_19454 [Dorcoceras hygrometricum]|uniref:Uncharacterized protein n=1 Tax=Dorcoceras hygrometricum TaxID=472368 RepID=A0A2Z6ZZ36_9LAMI|nr:hypothetical protein F511_19454 [Dorcoceras hygrometricum]